MYIQSLATGEASILYSIPKCNYIRYTHYFSFCEQVTADVLIPTEGPYNVNNILVTKLWILFLFVFLQVLLAFFFCLLRCMSF